MWKNVRAMPEFEHIRFINVAQSLECIESTTHHHSMCRPSLEQIWLWILIYGLVSKLVGSGSYICVTTHQGPVMQYHLFIMLVFPPLIIDWIDRSIFECVTIDHVVAELEIDTTFCKGQSTQLNILNATWCNISIARDVDAMDAYNRMTVEYPRPEKRFLIV